MTTYQVRGKAQLERAAAVIAQLSPDKPWRIEVNPHRARRSPEQNALLWALYTEVASGTGHTPEEIHEACKRLFLPPKTIVIADQVVQIPGSTAKLDTREFSEFVERVQAWAASEIGVSLA